jgi:CubicO group peptidase (beta-lactamase class C family)
MTRRDLLLSAAPAALATPALATPALAQPAAAALDAFLRAQVEQRRAVGIAAQVVRRDGTVAYAGAAGRRDPDSPDAVGPETLFRLASMTKPITAVATLMLVEEGRIALDDPLDRFLPAFGAPRVQTVPGQSEPAARVPTIRDLLRHVSGLSYRFMNVPGIAEDYARRGVDDGLAAPELTMAENMRRLAAAPLQAQPGTRWGYGMSFDVLGAVIEHASGLPFDRFVIARIGRPLGMASLVFHVPESERGRMARAMMVAEDGGIRPIARGEGVPFAPTGGRIISDPERAFSATAYPSGGGGATATLGDYVRFARMLLNGGTLDGVRLLRAATVAAMGAPQTGDLPISLAGPGFSFGYGVAVLVDREAATSPQPDGAYGWSGVYGTGVSIDPASGLAFVLMTQTAVEGMMISDEFVRAFYAQGVAR